MKNRLFLEIDNSPLIIFRIFFGFLLACETFGAILTGWVKENFIEVNFTFSHIGMEWKPAPRLDRGTLCVQTLLHTTGPSKAYYIGLLFLLLSSRVL